MPLTVRGLITLGGTQFPCDPGVYEPMRWAKRLSLHQGIGNSVTIQDFGITVKDLVIRLESGPNQFLDTIAVKALHGLFRTLGGEWTLTDWLGNQMTVFIADFEPKFFTVDLWTYTMTLLVRSATKLLDTTYSGG